MAFIDKQKRLDKKLLKACCQNKTDAVKPLLEAGASVHALDESHTTPFLYACRRGNQKIIELLLPYKPDLAATTQGAYFENAFTLLIRNSSQETAIEMMSLLIKQGGDIHQKIGGNTLLHIAAYRGQFDIVKFLVENGADMQVKDGNGNRALENAISNQKLGIVAYLKEQMGELDKNKEVTVLQEGWQLTAAEEVSFVSEKKGIGYRLTEIFNFEAQTYTRISQNLKTNAETQVFKEFDEFMNVSFLEKAHEALLAQGGQAEKPVIKTSRLHKLGKTAL